MIVFPANSLLLLFLTASGFCFGRVVSGKVRLNCEASKNNGLSQTDDSQLRFNNPWENGRYYYSDNLASLPSLPRCKSQNDNARGIYNSYLAPCEFSFHKSAANKKESGDGSTSFGHLPTVCNNQNKIALTNAKSSTSMSQYVYGWKDECVGNFLRCYSVSKHQNIYLALFCRKMWDIPDGTTHISVNCTQDNNLAKAKLSLLTNRSSSHPDFEYIQKSRDKELALESKRWYEFKAFVAGLVAVVMMVCIGLACFGYLWVVKPYFLTISPAAKRSELKDLVYRSDRDNYDDDDEEENGTDGARALSLRQRRLMQGAT